MSRAQQPLLLPLARLERFVLRRLLLCYTCWDDLDDSFMARIEEEWDRVAFFASLIDDAMDGALEEAIRSALKEVADVHNKSVWDRRRRDPVCIVIQYFECLHRRELID